MGEKVPFLVDLLTGSGLRGHVTFVTTRTVTDTPATFADSQSLRYRIIFSLADLFLRTWERWEEGAAMNFDRIVIGNGQDAVDAALAAARRGELVALAKQMPRQWDRVTPAILSRAVDQFITQGRGSMSDLREIVASQVQVQEDMDRAELNRLGVATLIGETQFIDARSVRVGNELITANEIVLAMGTRSAELGRASLDGNRILVAEDLLSLDRIPASMIVVGAGRAGLRHAILLAKLGVTVTIVDDHLSVFELCGGLMDTTVFEAQSLDVAFRLGEEVIGIERRIDGSNIGVRLSSGRVLTADAALVCIGREGRTDGLHLEEAGVGTDEHGRIWCDAMGRTWTQGITAIGDVVGFRATSLMAG